MERATWPVRLIITSALNVEGVGVASLTTRRMMTMQMENLSSPALESLIP